MATNIIVIFIKTYNTYESLKLRFKTDKLDADFEGTVTVIRNVSIVTCL